MTNTNNPAGYLVRSSINPKMVLCTDGQFRAQGVHTGPGTGHTVKVYKTQTGASKVRGGAGITVEPA